jgi:HAD superfamily hydrolase (TIGR01509 family)
MNPLRVQGVIFDVDGTLADSVGFFYEIALEVLELADAPPVPKERVYELMRLGDAAPLEKLFPPDYPDPAATLKRIVDSRMNEWMRRYHHETEAIPGSLDLLHDLHARGLRLGIATSSGRALPFLDRWGVRHLFSGIVGREDVAIRKPHPEPVLKCLGHLGLSPREVVYVGDSPIDIRAGRAAGSYTVGVLTGTSPHEVLQGEGPDHILESVAHLHRVLLL